MHRGTLRRVRLSLAVPSSLLTLAAIPADLRSAGSVSLAVSAERESSGKRDGRLLVPSSRAGSCAPCINIMMVVCAVRVTALADRLVLNSWLYKSVKSDSGGKGHLQLARSVDEKQRSLFDTTVTRY